MLSQSTKAGIGISQCDFSDSAQYANFLNQEFIIYGCNQSQPASVPDLQRRYSKNDDPNEIALNRRTLLAAMLQQPRCIGSELTMILLLASAT